MLHFTTINKLIEKELRQQQLKLRVRIPQVCVWGCMCASATHQRSSSLGECMCLGYLWRLNIQGLSFLSCCLKSHRAPTLHKSHSPLFRGCLSKTQCVGTGGQERAWKRQNGAELTGLSELSLHKMRRFNSTLTKTGAVPTEPPNENKHC